MNSKIILVARILLAIVMLVFGVNKFANFLPPPELDGEAGAYFGALMSANVITVVAVLEILTGLAFLSGRYVALALVINAPLAFNAFLFHALLDPAGIGPSALWIVLLIVLLVGYKDKYAELLKG